MAVIMFGSAVEGTTKAELVIAHAGTVDPQTEGWDWIISDENHVGAVIIDDPPTAAWFINDYSSTEFAGGTYWSALTPCERAAAEDGWTLRACLRVDDPDDSPSMAVLHQFGDVRYGMWFRSDASGNPIVLLDDGDFHCGNGPSGTSYTETDDGSCHALGFHLFELIYDPTDKKADLFVDGVLRVSKYAGRTDAGIDHYVSWQTGSTCYDGYAEFHLVEFEIAGESCDGDANGDGTVDPLDSGFVQARFGCEVSVCDDECDAADVNFDGAVDPLDVGYVLARFGGCS